MDTPESFTLLVGTTLDFRRLHNAQYTIPVGPAPPSGRVTPDTGPPFVRPGRTSPERYSDVDWVSGPDSVGPRP